MMEDGSEFFRRIYIADLLDDGVIRFAVEVWREYLHPGRFAQLLLDSRVPFRSLFYRRKGDAL